MTPPARDPADPVGRRRILLVGAGHAHLPLLRHADRFRSAGLDLTVIAPGPFWYSGLATGVLGGMYPPELDQVDVRRLTEAGGGRFIEDRVTRIDRQRRVAHLAGGGEEPFDVISLNVGSEPAALSGLEEAKRAAPEAVFEIKPLSELARLRCRLESLFAAQRSGEGGGGGGGGGGVRVVIAGGGASACEIAGNICRLAERGGGRVEVTLLARGRRLLGQCHEAAARKAQAFLERRGVDVRLASEVVRVGEDAAATADDRQFGFDVFVNATGLGAAPLIEALGLPTADDGGLLVDDHLRSVADGRIFGGGDCITMKDQDLPKIGVFAVREAPVLLDNLIAAATGRPLKLYRPQKRFLLILNLGDGSGLAVRGGLSWHGRAAMWLKDRLDRRFLKKHRPG